MSHHNSNSVNNSIVINSNSTINNSNNNSNNNNSNSSIPFPNDDKDLMASPGNDNDILLLMYKFIRSKPQFRETAAAFERELVRLLRFTLIVVTLLLLLLLVFLLLFFFDIIILYYLFNLIYLSIYLSIYPIIYLNIYLSYLSIYLSRTTPNLWALASSGTAPSSPPLSPTWTKSTNIWTKIT